MNIKYKTDPRAPRSIPAKYRKHIEDWSDERNYGNGFQVTLVGLCIDGPGNGDSKDNCHCFGEESIAEVKSILSIARPCSCDLCQSLIIE